MPSLLNKPWFVAGLGVTALVLSGRALLPPADGRPPGSDGAEVPAAAAAAPLAEVAPPSPAAIEQVLQLVATHTKTLRDPFAPRAAREPTPSTPAEQRETIQLSGVWVQGGTALGVVNDRICRPGEMVGGATIDEITAEGIWLTHPQGRDFVAVGRSVTFAAPSRPATAPPVRLANHEG